MNRIRPIFAGTALAAVLAVGAPVPPPPAAAQAPVEQAGPGVGEYRGAGGLGLLLRRVGTTKRVLMVAAHPDDEDTQLLAALALEQGADVAYLSLTRGEGGQNGIGPELGEALGLLRSEELLAARRVDGARQFFTRAYDFGYSRTAEETFRHWPREAVLGDVVRVIRRFRPDIVVTVFGGTPADGHGHHQASAILAREAFEAAGDPARFPEQLAEGLRPHRPAKLYRTLRGNDANHTVRLPMGRLDPLLGRSPFQLAMASRSRHRSQDMGRPELAGPRWGYLRRILPEPAGPEASMWEGIDTVPALSPAAVRGGGARFDHAGALRAVRDSANPLRPEAVVGPLATLLAVMDAGGAAPDAADRLRDERADVEAALAAAAGLVLDAVADDASPVPGQTLEVELSVWNGGARPVRVTALAPDLPAGWRAEPAGAGAAEAETVAPGALLARRFRVHVPADAAVTEPYFLRAPRDGDLYRWPAGDTAAALPFEAPPVAARATVVVEGAPVTLHREATFRDVDLRAGEIRRPVLVVPAVSVRVDPATLVLPTGGAAGPVRLRVGLRAESPAAVAGRLEVAAPDGWRVLSGAGETTLAAGESRDVVVTLAPPAGVAAGEHPVRVAFVAADGRRFERGVERVDHPHVRPRPLLHAAATRVRAFDVRVPAGLRVAYIEGAGEAGPGVLAQLGIVPDLLDEDDLAGADLSRYDVIVAGSRAYEVRADLARHNPRLLDYVAAGGTFLVLYNKYELVEGRFTPYPLTMARPHDRVTDEGAPVRLLEPAHPVFTTPNRIGPADWEGWVQERGLYFARTWDAAYTPLLETGDADTGPLRGGLLVARHGEGTYVYTGLAFFRQLPEGVPGAWRLFANLLALGARDTPAR